MNSTAAWAPTPLVKLEEDDKTRVQIAFGYDDLRALQYPILVECWDRVMGSGSKRRAYLAEFDEPERATIARYRRIFYDWHCRTGTPRQHVMKFATWRLLKRAIDFFASH